MQKYMRCTQCGYDLYGHEYLANVIDTASASNCLFYGDQAILETCTKSNQDIICPFCKQSGSWTTF